MAQRRLRSIEAGTTPTGTHTGLIPDPGLVQRLRQCRERSSRPPPLVPLSSGLSAPFDVKHAHP